MDLRKLLARRKLNGQSFSAQYHYDKLIVLCKRYDAIEKINLFC